MSSEIFEEEQVSSFREQDVAALAMDSPLPERYTVFLSHCGEEKPFARKLNDALRRNGLDVFFDERDLPLGEPFSKEIKLAAENCRVALVVLSGGFLSRKWPMLEAELFQASKESSRREMKIVPLFFKVSCSDLKDEKNQATWFDAWRKSVGDDHRSREEQWEKWKRVVKKLDSSSGLEFKKFGDEEEFIKIVVQRICRVAPPFAKFDESEIEGKERLVQEVMQRFECDATEVSTSCHAIVGVFGIGGIGKSTLCMLLCNEHSKQFPGKVFYLELDEAKNCTADRQLERQKHILRGLCDETSESLTAVQHPSQGWAILKQKMPYQDVFLVLDNVWESSLEEAKEYMKVRYSRHSRVLVMSRYKSVLEKVFLAGGRRESCCMAMPDLRKEEAMAVFLQAAILHKSSLNGDQLSVVERCVSRCCFRKSSNESESSETTASLYHPLSLRVFGASLSDQGEDPSKWKIGRSKWFERENRVFSVIGTSYEDLPVRTKQVFLDLAVFLQLEFEMRYLSLFSRPPSGSQVNEILRQLHGKDVAKEVQKLRDRMILDSHGMTMHDLFKEFARMVARTGEFGDPQSRCIYRTSSRKFSGPSIEKDASVMRVLCIRRGFQNSDMLELAKYSQVEVLVLDSCDNLKRLDVGAMKNLIYLRLSCCWKLVEVSGMRSVQNLAWCYLDNCESLEKITGDTQLSPAHGPLKLPSSRVFSRALCWKSGASSLKQLSDCPLKLPNLRVFVIGSYLRQLPPDWLRRPQLIQLSVNNADLRLEALFPHLKRLEVLDLASICLSSERIDLRGLPKLRNVFLSDLFELRELAGLDTLIFLTSLQIRDCPQVRELAGLEALTAPLRELQMSGLKIIRRLPDLGQLTALDGLEISHCDLVTEVLGLNKLANLCQFRISSGCGRVHVLPDVSELTKLRTLEMGKKVESVPGLERIAGGLTTLKCSGRLLTTQLVTKLSATLKCCGAAPQVEQQTASGLSSGVTDLSFQWCPDLTSLDYLQDLFPLLQNLSINHCPLPQLPRKLPSTIEALSLSDVGITSLPADLFAACSRLSSLHIYDCEELSSRELMTLWQGAHRKPEGLVQSIIFSLTGQHRQWEQVSSELSSQEISSFLMAALDECPYSLGKGKCILFQEPSSLCLSTSDSTVDAPLLICNRTMTAVCENPELLTKFLKEAADVLIEALASGECEEQLQKSGFHQLLLQLSPTTTSYDFLESLKRWCTILHTVLTHYPNLRGKLKSEGILNVLRCRLQDVRTTLNELDEDDDVRYKCLEKFAEVTEKWLGKCIAAVR